MKTVKTIYLIVIISITVFVVGFFGARKIRAFSGLFSDADIVKDSVTVEPFKEVKLVADVANFAFNSSYPCLDRISRFHGIKGKSGKRSA